jgi:hypothetical protein
MLVVMAADRCDTLDERAANELAHGDALRTSGTLDVLAEPSWRRGGDAVGVPAPSVIERCLGLEHAALEQV